MKSDLLTSLRKYKITERDPIENFITEAFAWLLKNYDSFSSFFINEITSRLNTGIDVPKKVSWITQKNFGGVFPDMVCEFDDNCFVFEHKAWSSLHENQLNNYREYAEKNYKKSYIILITAQDKQHKQDPDLAICWYDVYKIISDWVDNNKNTDDLFMFSSFQDLLVNEGMGPAALISRNSIISYYPAKEFIGNTLNLVTRIYEKEEKTFRSIFKKFKEEENFDCD